MAPVFIDIFLYYRLSVGLVNGIITIAEQHPVHVFLPDVS